MNKKGFGLVFILAALPSLLSFVFGIGVVIDNLLLISKGLHHCRTKSLSLQENTLKNTKSLLKLNSKISRLQLRKKHLLLKLASVPPPAKPFVLAQLKIVEDQLIVLWFQQKTILTRDQIFRETWAVETSKPFLRSPWLIESFQKGQLPVEKQSAEIPPTYKITKRSESKTRFGMNLKYQWSWPIFLQSILSKDSSETSFKCHSLIERSGLQWFPRLS